MALENNIAVSWARSYEHKLEEMSLQKMQSNL